ncbi:MAG: Gldg family protein [Lysobacterales bacterium]
MNIRRQSLFSAGSIALLLVLFIALVILSEGLLRGWRLDLTENRQYTLSAGTENILSSLEEPVTVRLFFSEQASREFPQVRDYAKWVGEMLDELAERSDGRLTIRRINPLPFSPEEDEAAGFGLQAVPVGTGGESLYFGLVGTNSLDDVQVMSFLQPSKEQFLEYDLAKMIATLSRPEQQKVGLLTSLDMGPGFDPMSQSVRAAWVIYDQLDQLFELETISATADSLPADIDLLFLAHPRDLSEAMRYQIDQFVLGGGRLMLFLDPFAESDTGGDPSDPMARLNAGSSSNLESMLAAWGVSYDPAQVIGDLQYALQVSVGPGTPPVRHLGILSMDRDGLNDSDMITADLEAINTSSAGWLTPIPDTDTQFEPLISTSENAAPLDASRLRFLSNPLDLLDGFKPSGDRYPVAARLSGPARSAFERPPEGQDPDLHRASATDAGINIVVFADTDILTDRLWVQKQNFLGQTLVNSFADNGSLVINGVDHLLGSQDLISIRTRATSTRPFDRVAALRLLAEKEFRVTEEKLQRELEETERKLTEMQSVREDADLTVLSEAQQDEIQRFVDQRLQIRKELREVRHSLDRDIDALSTRLKVINIALVPALVIVVALLLSHVRRRRHRSA